MFGFEITFLISQILAGIAIISDIFSFQFKKRKKIIILFIISASCIALHYLFLGRNVGAVIVGIGIIRLILSYYYTKKFLIYIFIFLFGVVLIIFYKDIYDIFMFIGISFITIGVFQKKDRNLRLFMMLGTSLIIFYNFLIFSPVGVILESIFLSSNIIGYYRYYLK